MKLKYIFASIVAALALVSCEKEADHYLKEIKVSSSYVALNTAGGSTAIEIEATDSWSISEMPEWLSISPALGSAGKTTVNFSAGEGEGRTAEIVIKCGEKTQRINVIQGIATVSNATCAEVIAGPDSKTYRVTGTVTGIVNTTYGNWYLQDETGEIYIYGTLDAKGNTKNFLSLGLEVGDEVTVEGPKTTYNGTVELVDVTVLKINKSLIKVESTDPEDAVLPQEGGDLTVTLANKGNNIGLDIPEEAKSWLGVSSISDNVVVLTAAPNEGGDRETTVVFNTTDGKKDYTAELKVTQKGAILDVSVAEFLAAPVGSVIYRVTGVITNVANPTYGNVYIKDFSGEAYVYGIGAKGDFQAEGILEGDIITLLGNRGEYKGSAQMTGGQLESITPVTEADIPTILAAADGGYYRVTGTVKEIKNDVYGNIYITDGTNDLYVYGCYPGVGASGDARKGVVAAEGIEVGDILTVFGPKSTYNGSPQINGGFFWSLEKGGSDEPGGDEPGGDDVVTVTSPYVLAVTSGENNSYAGNCDITINGVVWNLTGNSTMDPWRIGGKSITDTDRELYSKTPISFDVASIVVEHGTVNDIKVNSFKLIVSTNADFSAPVSTLTGTVTANENTTFTRPEGTSWKKCYYKFIYNVTVEATSNKFVQFKKATFSE